MKINEGKYCGIRDYFVIKCKNIVNKNDLKNAKFKFFIKRKRKAMESNLIVLLVAKSMMRNLEQFQA